MSQKTVSDCADVLAVLHLAREALRNSTQQTPDGLALHSAVFQAIAAVAELIENAALLADDARYGVPAARMAERIKAVNRSIARCGGAP